MRRPRRGPRTLVALLALAGLLVGGLFIADAYAKRRVERSVASALQDRLGTATPPAVTMGGSVFLVQILAGSIRSVHVVADQIPRSSQTPLSIASLDVVLSEVTTDDRFATMQASRVDGEAFVDYSELAARAGFPLEYGGGGRVQVRVTAPIGESLVQAVVTGTLQVDTAAQTLTLGDPRITVAGVGLPDETARQLIAALVKPISLEGLPAGVSVTSVQAEEGGVRAIVGGVDVPITR